MASKYRVPVNVDATPEAPPKADQSSSGCRVSVVHGFILLLLAIAIAAGIGVIVYFAGSRDIVCQCGDTAGDLALTPEALEQQCIHRINEGNGRAVCDACHTSWESTSTGYPSTAPSPTEAPRDYRLPIIARPYLYTLELQPNVYGGEHSVFDFEGSVKIATVAEQAEDTIILHAHKSVNVNEQSLRARNVNTSAVIMVTSEYEEKREFLTLHLSQKLVVGHHYEISADFRGPLDTGGRGFFVSHYEENGKKIYLAATQLEPTRARSVFPCFDEPALKAKFDTTLVRRSGGEREYTSLTNTQRIRTFQRGNGMVADIYERTVTMPTYLLAFIVCDFTYLETNTSNIRYRTWAMPQMLQFANKAQDHGVKIFDKLAEHFQPAYSLSKLDNIGIPDFTGGMENWGLIIYATHLYYEPGVSTGSLENWIAAIISHEIAHQWFGNLVSPKWWNWVWLNEAFASFWDYHVVGEVYPEWHTLEIHVVDKIHSALQTDSVRSSHPMSPDQHSIQSPSEIGGMFDGISYSKGSGVIRMMHLAMGQSLFIKGLNRYLRNHAYGNAEHQDLWDALTEEAQANSVDLDMKEIMDPWVTQMNFPVVNVAIGTGKITLTQHRFLASDEENSHHDKAKYGYKWTIPITYTTSNNPNFTTDYIYSNVHYMKYQDDEMVLNINIPPGGWILVNLQQCGFFRVNYDVTNWMNVINYMKNNDHTVIHPINRAQFINDAWNLAKAGMLDLSIALNAVSYLRKDPDYAPWRAFQRELGHIDDMLKHTALYGLFQEFMNKAVSLPYATLGSNITEEMTPFTKIEMAQMVSLACQYDHKACVTDAMDSFNIWTNSPSGNPIAPDIRVSFYCTAVRHGGLSAWMFIHDRYKEAAADSAEKRRLRQALACTREPWLLQRLLEMSVDANEFQSRNFYHVITSVSNNQWGRELAWNHLVYNLEHISSLIKSTSNMKSLVVGVTNKYNTEQELKKVQAFMKSGADLTLANDGFEEAVNKTQTNINWIEKNYHSFSSWLMTQ